jgi:predicted nucleic acid-binding protein
VRTIVFDHEAAQALVDPRHRKHRIVTAHLAGVAVRRRRTRVDAVVPTAVRVEAGWDRTSAAAGRFRIRAAPLDARAADVAAKVVATTGVSVADTHVGAAARATDGEVVVLTSDPGDIVRVAGPKSVVAVRI